MAKNYALDAEGTSSSPVSPRVRTMNWLASKLKSAKAVSHVVYSWDEDETSIRLQIEGVEQEILFDVSRAGVFSGTVSIATKIDNPRSLPEGYEAFLQDLPGKKQAWYAAKSAELFTVPSEIPVNMLVPHIIVELRKQARALAQ